MEKGVEVSYFVESDQEDAKQLVLAGLEEHWGALDPTKNLDLADISSNYCAVGAKFLVARAEEGRIIVGCGALVPRQEGDTGEIVRMSVSRDFRRQGLGRLVLARLLEEARRLGMKKVILETTETWQDAIDFYKAQGFCITHYLNGDVYFEKLLQ